MIHFLTKILFNPLILLFFLSGHIKGRYFKGNDLVFDKSVFTFINIFPTFTTNVDVILDPSRLNHDLQLLHSVLILTGKFNQTFFNGQESGNNELNCSRDVLEVKHIKLVIKFYIDS